MKRGLKIAGIVFAIVLLVVIGLLVLAQVLITPERIRSTVLPMARDALNNREIELSDIQVSLFSGIRLQELRIRERDSTEKNFVTAQRVVLRYQLLPLLAKRVVIDEVRLVDPTIRVERLADGSFNFSDLLAEEEGGTTESAGEPADGGPPVDLLVSEIAIENGELVFLDHVVGADAPYRTKLSELEFSASDISLDQSFPVAVEAMINQAQLEIDGRIDPDAPGVQADIRLADFDITAFVPYFREQLPGQLNSLIVNLNLSAEGSAESVHSQGEILFKEIELLLPGAEEPLRLDLVRFDYNMNADLEQDTVEIDDTVVSINGIPLHFSGTIEDVQAEPRLDIVLAISELDVHDAVQAIPELLPQAAVDLEPAGVVDMRIQLAGKADAEPAAMLREGELDLDEVMVTVGGTRPELNGRLLLAGDTINSKDLELRVGENQADIDLQASNLFGDMIEVNHTLSSERFELDALLAAAGVPAGGEDAGEADREPPEEIGPIDLPLRVDGAVSIGETIYRGLTMSDFRLRYHIVDNVLTVERLSGNIAEGSFNQTARADLGVKGFAYRGSVEVDGVKADPFVSAFLPKASGTVFGSLDLNGTFEGRGTVPETLKKQLSGKGEFSLVDGKLTGAGLVQELAGYLDLEELRVMQISKAAGDLALDQGKVRLDSNFSGSDVRMAPKGTIGLDGKLDLALNARLSPKLTERLGKGEIGSLLAGEEGWAMLPLKVNGTWSSPRFDLDTAALKQRAGERARQEVQQKLQEKVFDKLAPSEEEGGEEESPGDSGREALEDAVRGLFGD